MNVTQLGVERRLNDNELFSTEPVQTAAALERQILRVGRQLLARARASERGAARWYLPARWEAALSERAMRSEGFRLQLFRFIDVLPSLTSDAEVARHLREYLGDYARELPAPFRWGLAWADASGPASHLVAAAVRRGVIHMAHRFIVADNLPEAVRVLRRLHGREMGFTVDILGEATVSEREAAEYERRYLALLDGLAPEVATWPAQPRVDQAAEGRAIPRVNVSVKLTALYSQIDPIDPEGSAAAAKERLRPILRRARELAAFITLDMEQYRYKDLTLRIFREILMEPEFRDWSDVGIAMQAYLRDTRADVAAMIDWSRARGAPVSVRLVRGAYWDYEVVLAQQHGWPIPVFTKKVETDRSYETCARMLLEAYPAIHTAIATHNVRSIAHALVLAHHLELPERAFEFQMLYGMADPLKAAMVGAGQRLRVYAPYGELIPGMAYLVRRLLENVSNESFMRQGFTENRPPEELLRSPWG
jgi:RHH-type transcriptional regulator, proline utilization regulon repressor / proline dehydrogenase / delta 1-pyrroline-5-carboxylate dehydrogenase